MPVPDLLKVLAHLKCIAGAFKIASIEVWVHHPSYKAPTWHAFVTQKDTVNLKLRLLTMNFIRAVRLPWAHRSGILGELLAESAPDQVRGSFKLSLEMSNQCPTHRRCNTKQTWRTHVDAAKAAQRDDGLSMLHL
eukprot:9492793-Pyramimonas_sp.AAC.2